MEEKETARVEAFSDGVFAIAITLLVLGLVEPHLNKEATNTELLHELKNIWASYLAFAFSFFTILVMWINHHGLFRFINRLNNRFLLANGLLLMAVTFINFPTKIISHQLDTPSAKVACAFFTGSYLLISIAYNWVWWEAKKLMKQDLSQATVKAITRNYLIGFPLYVIALILSFISVAASLVVFILITFFWIFTMKDNHSINHKKGN